MKVLITGANGFIGKNLVSTLREYKGFELVLFDRSNTLDDLKEFTQNVDFVIHLAGVNRPQNEEDFIKGNVDLTESLCSFLIENDNRVPILMTSSTQSELDNAYGHSKKSAEDLLIKYADNNNEKALIYRLPNVYGKWSRPFYNSVIATWCHQISRGEKIKVDNPDTRLTLVYIDDVISEIIAALNGYANHIVDNFYAVPISNTKTLKEISELLYEFKESRNNLFIPNQSNDFAKKLYSTYLYYLPTESFSYNLKENKDERGKFSEFVKTIEGGQVSISTSKPGVVRGNHWHHTKNEKFLVVKGEATFEFRDIFEEEVVRYQVSGSKLEVVDIPPGYTHNIINTGDEDLITLIWVNEPFNPEEPDTYYKEV